MIWQSLAKNIIVMNHGKIEFMGTPREVFTSHADRLREIGLDVPQVLELATKLRQKGFDIREDILNSRRSKDEILKSYERKESNVKRYNYRSTLSSKF